VIISIQNTLNIRASTILYPFSNW